VLDVRGLIPAVVFIARPMFAYAWPRTIAEDKDTRQRYVSSKRTCAMDEYEQAGTRRGARRPLLL
jgi:hypothetical protein